MRERMMLLLVMVLSLCAVAQSSHASDWDGAWAWGDGQPYFVTVERNGVLLFVRLDTRWGETATPGATEGNYWVAGVGSISGDTATVTEYGAACQYVFRFNVPSGASSLTLSTVAATPASDGVCEIAVGESGTFTRIF